MLEADWSMEESAHLNPEISDDRDNLVPVHVCNENYEEQSHSTGD